MKISVIGAGTYGTALANALKKENEICLYTRNTSVIEDINTTRKNLTYFPTKILSKKIRATNNLEDINNSALIFICMPSYAVVDFFSGLHLREDAVVVNGAKGFGIGSRLIPESLQSVVPNQVASMKGPSFANEMIFDLPTAFTIASHDENNFVSIPAVFRKELVVFDFSKDVTELSS